MAVRITRAGVGLTVGIIILALVIIGGLYLVRERGEQARREDAIEVAQQNLEENSQPGTITPAEEGAENDNGSNSGSEGQPATGGTENQTETQTGDREQGQAETQPESTPDAQAAPSELPATGPNDMFALIVVGLLGFSITSYLASRKALERAR